MVAFVDHAAKFSNHGTSASLVRIRSWFAVYLRLYFGVQAHTRIFSFEHIRDALFEYRLSVLVYPCLLFLHNTGYKVFLGLLNIGTTELAAIFIEEPIHLILYALFEVWCDWSIFVLCRASFVQHVLLVLLNMALYRVSHFHRLCCVRICLLNCLQIRQYSLDLCLQFLGAGRCDSHPAHKCRLIIVGPANQSASLVCRSRYRPAYSSRTSLCQVCGVSRRFDYLFSRVL